jgi:hypothetical protein
MSSVVWEGVRTVFVVGIEQTRWFFDSERRMAATEGRVHMPFIAGSSIFLWSFTNSANIILDNRTTPEKSKRRRWPTSVESCRQLRR